MASKNKPTVVVIIPTYNEADTIGDMITHLFTKTFPTIKDYQMHLLVVDDTSPDGTYKIVKSHQKKYQNLHLLTNPKKAGIGYAYIVGFKHAMTKLKADFIFEFDGDFQHPPKMIPQMLEQATQGFDVVIGSRKIKGGSNPKGWGFKRVMFSELGGLVARFILFFPGKNFLKVTDPTTGLRLTRVKGFLDQVDFDHFYSLEFSYKLQLLYQLISLKPKFKELPLQFGLREKGESKIKGSTLIDSLRTAFLTRINDPATKKFLKFAIVGFTGFVVNSLGLEFFRRSGLADSLSASFTAYTSTPGLSLLANPNSWSGGLGAELAIISNFILNNFWTFSSDRITNPFKFLYKFLQFNLTSFGAVIIQFIAIGLATLAFGDTTLVRQLALVLSIGFLILPYNWLMYNLVIWRK